MNYRYVLLCIIIFFNINWGICQKHDFVFDIANVGLGMNYLKMDGYLINKTYGITKSHIDTISNSNNPILAAAYIDLTIPIFKIKNHSSFGINPGFQIMGIPSAGSGYLGAATPCFLTYKLGTDASLKKPVSKIGLSTGLGYQFLGLVGENTFFIAGTPIYMFEVNFVPKERLHKIRFISMIKKKQYTLPYNDTKGHGMYINIEKYIGIVYLLNI